MKTIFYITAFIIAAAIGAKADPAHRTFEIAGCDIKIKVPVALYQDALDAGLREWVAVQCRIAPLTSPRPVAGPWGDA